MSKFTLKTTSFIMLLTLGVISGSMRADDDRSDSKIADANQLLEILETSNKRKGPVLPDSGKVYGDHSVSCRLNIPENWRMSVSLSNNRRFVYLVFPCTNPVKQNSEIYKRMMIENRRMGLMRFEYSPTSNLISLVYPVRNKNLDFDVLDDMTRELIGEARRTEPLWSKAKQVTTKKSSEKKSSTDSISFEEGSEEVEVSKSKKSSDEDDSSEKPSIDGPIKKQTVASRMSARATQRKLTKLLHEKFKSDFKAEYTYTYDGKTHTGMIQFKKDGSYQVNSTSDKDAKPATGSWIKTARGIMLTGKNSNSDDLYGPTVIEKGWMKVSFRYGTPNGFPAASAPAASAGPKATYFREFTFQVDDE